METLGQFLKREREFRKMTLEDLSKASRIGLSFLRKIEEDRLEDLPKGSFVKGFLKTYVRHVGLNENEILARYESLKATFQKEEDPFKKFQRFDVKNQIVFILLFLVIVIALATFLSSR